MDFDDFVRLHHLTACIVTEIRCQHCFRVIVLSDGSLPKAVECPSCGDPARTIKRAVRAATSRKLPLADILKVRAGSLVFLARKLERIIPAEAADRSRFGRQLLKLRLNGNPEQWRTSEKLKIWVERNCGKTYIPEQLLRWWGLEVQESELNLAKSGEL